MTIVEATLWAIGSVVALDLLRQAVDRFQPSLRRDIAAFSLCQLIAYLALLLVIQTVYFPKTRLSVIFGARPGSWVFYPIAALLGIAIHFPADGLYEVILARWPAPTPAEEVQRALSELPLWRQVATGIGLVVTTPLIEEALFRGAIFGTLRRNHGAIVVVICTAMLFALIHVQPQVFLPIGLVGAALAFLRLASGSMWPGVILHMTFNGLTFYLLLQERGDSADAADFIPKWMVVTGTIASGGLLALTDFLRTRKKQASPRIEEEPS